MKKIVVAWIVCILGLVGIFGWLGAPKPAENHAESGLITGEFSLVGAEGETFADRDFHGSYTLIFFGFTHCPGICPTTLLLMQNTLDHLGDAGKKIQPIFISIDPERDTPEITAQYASRFGRTIGLSGSPEQIKAAADSFKVYYTKVPMEEHAGHGEHAGHDMGDYMMDHSGYLFLMGPDGRYLTHFPSSITEQALEEGLKKFIR